MVSLGFVQVQNAEIGSLGPPRTDEKRQERSPLARLRICKRSNPKKKRYRRRSSAQAQKRMIIRALVDSATPLGK